MAEKTDIIPETESPDPSESLEIKSSQRDRPWKKALRNTLVGGLIFGSAVTGSGCGNESKDNREPSVLEPEVGQEAILEEGEAYEGFGEEIKVAIHQELGRYPHYEINIGDKLAEEIDQMIGKEKYPYYKKELLDHSANVKPFVQSTGLALEYTIKRDPNLPKEGALEETQHLWTSPEGDFVSYDTLKDTVHFSFVQPLFLENIRMNPGDKQSVETGLRQISKEFFAKDFEYRVDQVSSENGLYRYKISRMLNGYPVHMDYGEPNLVLTSDGRVKEGALLLAEFQERGQLKLLSGKELQSNINEGGYGKEIKFRFIDSKDYDKFSEPFELNVSNEQQGFIDLDKTEVLIVYNYTNGYQENIVPTLLFQGGQGFVIMEEQKYEANFPEVLASIIALEYIK